MSEPDGWLSKAICLASLRSKIIFIDCADWRVGDSCNPVLLTDDLHQLFGTYFNTANPLNGTSIIARTA